MEKLNSNKNDSATLSVLSEKYHIKAPLFIMFAEYLGYVGETLQWCDDWCTSGEKPEDFKVKFIETEAAAVLKEAISKYGIVRLRKLYDELYDIILEIYEENLNGKPVKDRETLPY